MKKLLMAAFSFAAITANAQLKEGKKHIDKLCGCFEVDFKYAETFSPDTAYKFKDRYHAGGTELVIPVETTDKKIVLQHLLIINDSFTIKHWREDWEFEPKEQLVFEGNKKWKKMPVSKADAKGKWLQTVWEVDDAPRYQGISNWVNIDGKTYWENTADAPLPRREYTKRKDYQIMKRGNKIVVNNNEWIHEQDNDKIALTPQGKKLIAQEKGINAYTKTDDSKCAAAKAWWLKTETFWAVVRKQWQEVLQTENAIALQSKIEDKRLDEYFTVLEKKWQANTITLDQAGVEVKAVIEKFVNTPKDVATK